MWLGYAVKRMLVEDRMVFGDTPLLVKMFGVIAILGFAWMSFLPTAFWVYRVAWTAFLVFMACACAFHVNRLALDFAERTYLRERGVYPWLRREEGGFDEFERLHVSPGTIRTRYGTSPVWKVWLVRKQGAQSPGEPFGALFDKPRDRWDRNETVSLIERLAARMGLPLRFEPGM